MQDRSARPAGPRGLTVIIKKHWILYLMALPVMLYYVVFRYAPMFGIVIAFQEYRVTLGFWNSQWVGLKHFVSFFTSSYAWATIRNTLSISFYGLVFGFPAPILLALLLNEVGALRFKKAVQTVTYIPHFISLVVVCGLVREFLSTQGLCNAIIAALGGSGIQFLNEPGWFYPVYVASGIWQHTGWDSIIYMAALSAIDQELYAAAMVDGAGRFGRMWHVTLPGIAPTITILLILSVGHIMSVGFEKIILLYSPLVYETADVISTYVYRRGLIEGKYSFAAAVDLMNSVVNFVLLITADRVSKRLGQRGLF